MAVYVDYLFYTEQYAGTAISQADFSRLARQASAQIDQMTFERAGPIMTNDDEDYILANAELIEKIRMATCAVAEELQRQAQGGEIQAERVGNYQVSYVQAGVAASRQARLTSAAKVYLGATDLMYRSFNADEL